MRRETERRTSGPIRRRRGAAVVEFALIAPVFLTLVLGTIEMGNALDASQMLTAAIREGGRLASMDWRGVVPEGKTTNEKVTNDILNFVAAAGMPRDSVTVTITSAEGDDAGQPFDLELAENRLRLFRIEASVPYDDVSSYPSFYMGGRTVVASIVFRAGSSQLSD